AAMNEANICYILDAILFVYGLVLTVLYCRIKV
ncbi:receptor for gamma polypeptide precursor, partial [Silurus asotus]